VLNHPNPDVRGVERFFSIASAPREKHVMLTTRFAPKSSSFKKALKNLGPGDAIEAHDLEGDFVVDDSEKTFVFVAGDWHYTFPRHFAIQNHAILESLARSFFRAPESAR
jgi:predicted ferric reductase